MSCSQNKTYIIAEIGTSHGGSISEAYKLIDVAVNAGANCVKFQWVYASEILHPNTGFVQLPTGNIRLYDRFKELEVSSSFFSKVQKYAHKRNVDFACSPFGIKSLTKLWKIQPDIIKIASPELNHFPMLKKLCELGIDKTTVIISSGVSKLSDIEKALHVLEPIKSKVSLLHCITSYPAPETEYNLNVLNTLANRFHVPVGVSDHSLDAEIVPSIMVYAGGTIIEKHITLSNETEGLDDPVALTPDNFKKMVDTIRYVENLSKEEQYTWLISKWGKTTVEKVLGNGKKELATSESQNYERTNRSIHYTKNLKKGTKITKRNIAILRTEKILSVGISPEYYENIIGRRLINDVKNGEGLRFEHLLKQ